MLGVPEHPPLRQGLLPFRCGAGAATPRHGCVALSTFPRRASVSPWLGRGRRPGLGSIRLLVPHPARAAPAPRASGRESPERARASPAGGIGAGLGAGLGYMGSTPRGLSPPGTNDSNQRGPWAFSEAGPAAEQDWTRHSHRELARPPWWRGTPALARPVGIPTVTGHTMSHSGIWSGAMARGTPPSPGAVVPSWGTGWVVWGVC